MDILAEINIIIASQESAFLAGVIAAFTPCTLALIPLFLYRFGVWGKDSDRSTNRLTMELAMVIPAFLVSFVFTGLVFQTLVGSDFVNVTRLVLGTGLVFVGMLQLSGKISLQLVNRFSNPILVGLLLPWIISFSPCVLPYFASLLAVSTNGDTVLKFLLFGLGILTPAIVIAFSGNRLLGLLRRSGALFLRIERLSALLIIAAGLYLSSQLVSISSRDVVISAALILVLISYVSFQIFKKSDRRTVRNYALTTLILLIWLATTLHIYYGSLQQEVLYGEELLYACSVEGHVNCAVCTEAALSYSLVTILLGVLFIIKGRQGKKLKFKLELKSDE